MQVPAHGPPEKQDERGLRQLGDLTDGRDPAGAQLLGRDRADAPQPFDGKRMQERQLSVRRHDQQPVGLRDGAGDLGQELGPRHADRDRQSDLLEHPTPQAHGDLPRRARDPPQPAHVQERLVDRQALDERRRVPEHGEHGLARVGVRGHPRRDHDRLRAQPPRLRAAHRRTDAVRLGLVTGRQHDPAADDHRATAQLRVVALLDRRVERVEVGVEDVRFAWHEHMFARGAAGRWSRSGSRP
jgi:hypothetical protein